MTGNQLHQNCHQPSVEVGWCR